MLACILAIAATFRTTRGVRGPYCTSYLYLCYKTEASGSGILFFFSLSTCSDTGLLPRVKQHLSAFCFIEQLVRRFSLIKPNDPVDEAGLRAYFAEDVLLSGQQIKYEGEEGSNGAATKVKRRILSV